MGIRSYPKKKRKIQENKALSSSYEIRITEEQIAQKKKKKSHA